MHWDTICSVPAQRIFGRHVATMSVIKSSVELTLCVAPKYMWPPIKLYTQTCLK